MAARHLLIAVLTATACSKSGDGPKPTVQAEPAEGALSFVPGAISARLADANTLIAIDFRQLDTRKLVGLIEKELPCVAELVAGAGIVVIGEGEGYLTRLPEQPTRACLARVAPLFGATVEDKELIIGGQRYSLIWTDGTLHITKPGGGPSARLSAAQRARVARIPPAAFGWAVSNGYPKYKIRQSWFWLETDDTYLRFTVEAEGTEAGSARPWVASIVTGFKEGAASKGVATDDSWFTLTSTEMSAKLVAVIPMSVFDGVRP